METVEIQIFVFDLGWSILLTQIILAALLVDNFIVFLFIRPF